MLEGLTSIHGLYGCNAQTQTANYSADQHTNGLLIKHQSPKLKCKQTATLLVS